MGHGGRIIAVPGLQNSKRLLPEHPVSHAPGLEETRDARASAQSIVQGSTRYERYPVVPGERVIMLQHPTPVSTMPFAPTRRPSVR
jgi:hypothetical protein